MPIFFMRWIGKSCSYNFLFFVSRNWCSTKSYKPPKKSDLVKPVSRLNVIGFATVSKNINMWKPNQSCVPHYIRRLYTGSNTCSVCTWFKMSFDFGLSCVINMCREFRLHYYSGHWSIWFREDLIAKATEMRNQLQSMNFAAGSDIECQRAKLLHNVLVKLHHLQENDEEHFE